MAPKKLTTNSIVDFQPTPEELERAKSIIKKASEEEKRSKMQAMSGYCRRNADANGHGDVAASRGEDRWEYLYRYMAFQHRKNGGNQPHHRGSQRSEEPQDREEAIHLVPAGEALRGRKGDQGRRLNIIFKNGFSKPNPTHTKRFLIHYPSQALYWKPFLQWQPDRVTKSEDEEHREYILDDETDIDLTSHKNALAIQNEAAASKVDYDHLQTLRKDLVGMDPTASSSTDGAPQADQAGGSKVKKERGREDQPKPTTLFKQN